jgi:putative tryptophan/tyrosine transport system substrate-binding protein
MTRHRITLLMTLALGLLMASLLAEAQPAGKVPTIGLLNSSSATVNARPFEVFTQALRELGHIEGRNLAIERRYADGRPERLPALAAELIALNVDVFLVTTNNTAEAVRQLTTTIPIVMTTAEEPVHFGLVKSLAHPGGNITGVAIVAGPEIYGKMLELLTAVLPPGARIGVLFNPLTPVNALWRQATEEAARALGVPLVPAGVRRAEDFEPAVAAMQQGQAKGVIVVGDSLFTCCGHNKRINELAVRSGLAPMWPLRSGAESGGLMGYGTSSLERWRRAATYVDKILKGAKPADLPVEQPTTFELVINLKTAQALGLTIPPVLLFQATEVMR